MIPVEPSTLHRQLPSGSPGGRLLQLAARTHSDMSYPSSDQDQMSPTRRIKDLFERLRSRPAQIQRTTSPILAASGYIWKDQIQVAGLRQVAALDGFAHQDYALPERQDINLGRG